MSRRIDVELTSARDDGSWTWRAAGARQPKGTLDASVLYEDARVGDVVRADADFGIDGITVLHVYPPREGRTQAEGLQIIGPSRDEPGVTTSMLERAERPRRPPRPEWAERGRPGGPERTERRPSRPSGPASPQPEGGEPGGGGRRRTGPTGPSRDQGGGPLPGGKGGLRPGREGRPGGGAPAARPDHRPGRPAGRPSSTGTGRARPPRLAPGNAHRAAALASLVPEERPVAEQVLRGGMPAVRQAIEAQNAEARAEGRPEVRPEPLLAMAEQLLPRLKAAAWRDRAEAAVAIVDDIPMRDLRSVVTGADQAARDDESRLLAVKLREALDRRLSQMRTRWNEEIVTALDAGKILPALRASARAPDPGARFPAELAVRLSQAAGAAMTPETPPERWAILLEAVTTSPVRRTVKPVGLPVEPGGTLLEAAKHASGRVPALAGLLGIDMPPPPGPPRPPRPATARPGAPRPGSGPKPGAPGPQSAPPAGPSPAPPHPASTSEGSPAAPGQAPPPAVEPVNASPSPADTQTPSVAVPPSPAETKTPSVEVEDQKD